MLKAIFKLVCVVLAVAVFGVFGLALLALPLVFGYATKGVERLRGVVERLNEWLEARLEAGTKK